MPLNESITQEHHPNSRGRGSSVRVHMDLKRCIVFKPPEFLCELTAPLPPTIPPLVELYPCRAA
jgi:hypothetical protein